MAGYSLLIKRSAVEEVEAIARKTDRQRVVRRIAALAEQPRSPGCEKLAGTASAYRVRRGSFRIVYVVDDEQHAVEVVKVGHRREVYRGRS